MTAQDPSAGPFSLARRPVHLGPLAAAVPQPEFVANMDWYMDYGARHGADGVEGRLLSMHTFESSWPEWEVHPNGSEVVIVTAGSLRLHQEFDGVESSIEVGPGEYAINPPGVWHTVDVVDAPVTAVFVTTGIGTENRKRDA